MVTRVRSISIIALKVPLFIGLFLASARLIYAFVFPMFPEGQHQLFVLSQNMGIDDLESFYLFAEVVVNLIVAMIAYRFAMMVLNKMKAQTRHG